MSSRRNSTGAAGLILAYSCMAFPDALGVVAARLRLDGIASSLVFAWFALFSVPSGLLCDRFGSRRVAVFALCGTLPAFALLALGGDSRCVAAAGLALAGAANVALQVSLPSRAVELFGVSRQAGVLTMGLFSKTLFAMALPFVIAAFAHAGDWRLFFPAFGVVFAAAAALMWLGGGVSSRPRRGAASLAGVVEVARDVPTALSALSFAVGVIADVAFNLSVPDAVHLRFAMGDAASVAALLTMSIAGGALASPLIAAMSRLGARSAEVLSVAATAVLLLLSLLAKRLSGRCA